MANYLDLTGLTKYDELIKALIKSGDDELIAKINEVIGGDTVNKSLADIISIIGDVNKGETLAGNIDSLKTNHETDITNVNNSIDGLKADHAKDINDVNKNIESLHLCLNSNT